MPTDLPALRRPAPAPAAWSCGLAMIAMVVGATMLLVRLPVPEPSEEPPAVVLMGP